ncbi:MAG TPA: hypothetical protein VFJ43_09125 [Bacteroidia bacterium]|nr:hypothetical protein [Bacteroidia bacterium]
MKRMITPAVLLLSAVLIFNGCKKPAPADTETVTATDNSICENEFMRLLPTVNKIAIDESGVHRNGSGTHITSSCPTISVPDSLLQYPRHMIIDYGTGCTDPVDGKIRKGKIRCTFSGPWDTIGSVITISMDTFFVGAIQFEGTTTLTRLSATSFSKRVTNGKCTKGTAWTILYNADRVINITSGANVSTDPQIITITGTNGGTDRDGNTWTSTITSPVVRDLGCTWITKGTVDITPSGKSVRTVDFGDGTCDAKATITIDGNKFEFTMQ